jgi:hypothetical protein
MNYWTLHPGWRNNMAKIFHDELIMLGFAYYHYGNSHLLFVPTTQRDNKFCHYVRGVMKLLESCPKPAEKANNATENNGAAKEQQRILWEKCFNTSISNSPTIEDINKNFSKLSPEVIANCKQRFDEKMNKQTLDSCACCGVRDFGIDVVPVHISHLSILRLNLAQQVLFFSSDITQSSLECEHFLRAI